VTINHERQVIDEVKDWSGNMLCQRSNLARYFIVGENLFAKGLMEDHLVEGSAVQKIL
tara:strand:- start:444 stop:617 length:174 start_codon:yes stop_codon:yes gene_type:complete